MDIREFLEQRLAEDEAWARAASASPSCYVDERPVPPTGTHWTWGVGENWDPYTVDPLEEYVGEGARDFSPTLVTVEEWPDRDVPGRMHPNRVVQCEEIASGAGGHIVRHDPARVLRDVESKRRVLRLYDNARLAVGQGSISARNRAQDETAAEMLGEVLRALAAAYADHPGYQEAWRP